MSRNSPKHSKVHFVMPEAISTKIRGFLADKSADSREAAAFALCGQHRANRSLRLLPRHLVLPDDQCFDNRSAGMIRASKMLDQLVLGMADEENLVVTVMHTHLSDASPRFSAVDDHEEQQRALAMQRLFGSRVALASIVFNRDASLARGRFWLATADGAAAQDMEVIGSMADELCGHPTQIEERYDRQVRGFGSDFQERLSRLKIGVIGVGGLGGMIVEGLARLGVRYWVLVDPDVVEKSNLNRLPGATERDATDKTPKVMLARRNITQVHKTAKVISVQAPVRSLQAVRKLRDCHLLITAGDNDSSRLAAQEIASAYLRPVVNAGVGLQAERGHVKRISLRVSAPPVGGNWCLACGGQINKVQAAKEEMDPEHREMLQARGYLPDTPRPAVYWVNGLAANLAISFVHQMVMPFGETPPTDLFHDVLDHEILNIDHAAGGNGCPVCGADDGMRGLGDQWLLPKQAQLTELNIVPVLPTSDKANHRNTQRQRTEPSTTCSPRKNRLPKQSGTT
ncbi:MAG: hypothetical protein HGB35_00330 [Geobacteraceae bacterium]|nr:hypothetical protein [Geobacteraceae bacterium]